jgi:hypothetical protein
MKIHSEVRKLLRESTGRSGWWIRELSVENAATMERRDRIIGCFIELNKSKSSIVKNYSYKNRGRPMGAAEKHETHFIIRVIILSVLFFTHLLVNVQGLCNVFHH